MKKVLDYDYAPMSLLVGQKRMWLNITQEGKDDIDDLRAGGLLNALKLSSEDLQPVTAYQVSDMGKEIVELSKFTSNPPVACDLWAYSERVLVVYGPILRGCL